MNWNSNTGHFHHLVWSSFLKQLKSWTIQIIQKFKLSSWEFIKSHKLQPSIIEQFISSWLRICYLNVRFHVANFGWTDQKATEYKLLYWLNPVFIHNEQNSRRKIKSMWPLVRPRSLHGKRYKRFDSNLKFQSDLK